MATYIKEEIKLKPILRRDSSSLIKSLKKNKLRLILLMPAVVLTIIFSYIPMLGLVMAFQEFNIFKGFLGSNFVGFNNFIKIFTNPDLLKAIKNTLLFSSVGLIVGFPLPILLAILFNEIKNNAFKRVVQTISYMPHFLSWISVIAMFYTFFSTYGTFNDFRVWIFGSGVERTNILMNPDYFLPILLLSGIWKGIGWSSVIYLAAISGIDQQLYEAAHMDGCGKFKQIIYITIPSLTTTMLIIFILSLGSLVNSNFEQVYGFQNLFTQDKNEVINTMVYRQGIQNAQYSLATAFGLMQGLVSFLLVSISNKIIKTLSGTGIW